MSDLIGEIVAELSALKQSTELNLYTVYSTIERINAEIGAITDKVVDTYYDITRGVFLSRQIPHAASIFCYAYNCYYVF